MLLYRSNHKLRKLFLEGFRNMSNTGIHRLAFYGLENLSDLTLKLCNLTSVPVHAIDHLTTLMKLDLSKNFITVKMAK